MTSGRVSTITPGEMEAIIQNGTGGPEVLSLQTVPVSEPRKGQALIRVYAAAVNPIDWKIRGGYGPPPPPGSGPVVRIPGTDVSGVIEKTGSEETSFKPGDPVVSMIGRTIPGLNGSYAQFVLAPVENITPKPANLTYAEASCLGTAAMTAARAIHMIKLTRGQRLLITGAAGGVGSSAVQIARAIGAHVTGIASSGHHPFLRAIGADEIIDYTSVRFEEQVKEVDAVIDTIGKDTAVRAVSIVKKGGMFVTTVMRSGEEECAKAGVTFLSTGPGSGGLSEGELLREVTELAEAGKLKIHIDRTYPLEKAADAQNYNQAGHTEGKVVLIVDAIMAGHH
jgi:NADPH:quinone reductase-like Zn-dependent oxidoreductase